MAKLASLPSVGDGVTENLWSDSHAMTVIAIHGRTGFTAQRDKATRTNRDADTFTPGGFMGHTTSPKGQEWSYEADPEGVTKKFTLRKDGTFRPVGYGGNAVSDGRHEHYDYNF